MADDPFDQPVRIPVTNVLDLHSIPAPDVQAVVEEYLSQAQGMRLKALRIIHGKGIGFQRDAVRRVLQRTPFVEEFGDAPAEAGGWGATLVTLK
jgi:dsDNA-specific endonuclease/ATPase MutS2